MNTATLIPSRHAAKTAVFAGCARDCARHLPQVLAHMERLAARFDEVAYVFVENDSRDETPSLLAQFASRQFNCTVEHLNGLAQRTPARTERLAIARNRILELLRGSTLRQFDYLVLMDLDEVNSVAPSDAEMARALGWLDADPLHAAVFANQPDGYYDMWALRHERLCPGDRWEAVLDHKLAHPQASDQEAFDAAFAPYLLSLPREADVLEVDSAFGGLGIYKMPWALQGRYAGRMRKPVPGTAPGEVLELHGEVCEHVAFHADLRRQGGRLFVLPWLVNQSVPRGFPPSAWRVLYHDPKAPAQPLQLPAEAAQPARPALPAMALTGLAGVQPPAASPWAVRTSWAPAPAAAAAPAARLGFVIAHYDPAGRVAQYLVRLVQAMHRLKAEVVFVSTGLAEAAAATLRPFAQVIVRENVGYDFWSYKVGIEALRTAGTLAQLDRLVVLNSSFFIADPDFLLEAYVETEPTSDLMGMTYHFGDSGRIHLQSFWVAFQNARVIRSDTFARWWDGLAPLPDRDAVMAQQEPGLSHHFVDAGHTLGTMFLRTREQKCLSLLRAMASGFLRYEVPAQGPLEIDPDVGDMMDPTMFCWDGLFEALGVVKLRLLTQNPNRQNLDALYDTLRSRPQWQVLLADALRHSSPLPA